MLSRSQVIPVSIVPWDVLFRNPMTGIGCSARTQAADDLALVVDAVRKSVATPRGADKSGVDVMPGPKRKLRRSSAAVATSQGRPPVHQHQAQEVVIKSVSGSCD